MKSFVIETPAKVIVAGEHAVMRGAPALVLPLKSLTLKLYCNYETANHAQFQSSQSEVAFFGVLEQALKSLKRTRDEIRFSMRVENSIPLGSGLGASAALCATVAKLMTELGWLSEEEQIAFGRELENIFHGESSGVDVAAVLSDSPLVYQKNHLIEKLNFKWKPRWAISYSGARGVTKDCIAVVSKLRTKDLPFANEIDEQMKFATKGIVNQLSADFTEDSISKLATHINLAADCFEKWGLVQGALSDHINDLKKQGALALKPTGSGLGGHVLSLWPELLFEKVTTENRLIVV
jgi:mevalonate kinase